MDNLIFSLNATLPIFLLMVLGYIFEKIGIIDQKAASWMNKFVFKIALPVLLFNDLSTQDFAGTWDGKFVLFCFAATIISISVITIFSKIIIKDNSKRGEFIQGSYRSSAALLGISFIHNIYGDSNSGMAPLMILGSVPLYNIFAVIILTLTAPKENADNSDKKALVKVTATVTGGRLCCYDLAWTAATLWAWWKNNSVTEAAIEADAIKDIGILADI